MNKEDKRRRDMEIKRLREAKQKKLENKELIKK